MFNWSITLSDKQVLMLLSFATATPDQEGNQFNAVHQMIGGAWDVRAVRKLQEDGLLLVESYEKPNGLSGNRWTITPKGTLIASAVNEDAQSLRALASRNGLKQRRIINAHGNEVRKTKQKKGVR